MQKLLQNLLIDAIPDDYLTALWDLDKGYNQSTFHDIIFHIFDQFALITEAMVDDNKALFDQPVDVNKPLTVYIKKQEQCQLFAADAKIPISTETMVHTRVKHAISTGMFNDAYKQWKRLPIAQKTWNSWKNF